MIRSLLVASFLGAPLLASADDAAIRARLRVTRYPNIQYGGLPLLALRSEEAADPETCAVRAYKAVIERHAHEFCRALGHGPAFGWAWTPMRRAARAIVAMPPGGEGVPPSQTFSPMSCGAWGPGRSAVYWAVFDWIDCRPKEEK